MMTGIERINNILQHKSVDRIGLYENFWQDTRGSWTASGKIKKDESLEDHFGLDMQRLFTLNLIADIDFEKEILEETEDTILIKDGNGAILRKHKKHETTPEHVDFTVKDRAAWEEFIKPKLKWDRKRISFEEYRRAKQHASKNNRFFAWSGVNVFTILNSLCGTEYLLMGMALDPDWIKDMVETYSNLMIELLETLFSEEGSPDGIWFSEDMGFKHKPFFSQAMYKELIQPGHKKTIDYSHSRGLPVIMHSCGFVDPLLPGMIEAGIDCLQALEVKAGMDLLKLYKQYGDDIAFMGGIDVRTLCSNDKKIIDEELNMKIPELKKKFAYVIHSDHSIPETVEYDTYKYFIEKVMELGKY